jgi:hypothetical protein
LTPYFAGRFYNQFQLCPLVGFSQAVPFHRGYKSALRDNDALANRCSRMLPGEIIGMMADEACAENWAVTSVSVCGNLINGCFGARRMEPTYAGCKYSGCVRGKAFDSLARNLTRNRGLVGLMERDRPVPWTALAC